MDLPGKRIQRWREYLKKTRDDFAVITGIPYSTLSTLENNTDPTKKPSWDIIAKLRKGCPQLNIDWLFDEGDTEPMLKEDRLLAPVSSTQSINSAEPADEAKMPATVKRKMHTPMAIVRDVESMTKDEQIDYYKALAEMAEDRAAAAEAAQRHETAVRLVRSTGGRSFTEASLEAADTYTPAAMQVSHRNTEYQRFKPAAQTAPQRLTIRRWGN